MAEPLDLSIEYCTAWGYDKRAAGLAAELQQALPERVRSVRLIPSGGGVFEVRDGERLVYSKRALHRFPEEGEIVRLLKE